MLILFLPFISRIRILENYDEQRLIDTVPVTAETGRVHAGCASFEYLPSKAFENRNYIETRNQDAIIIAGEAKIEEQQKNSSKMSFTIKNVTDDTEVELPYIYYPGYMVSIVYNGQKENIQPYETQNGFVGIKVPAVEEEKITVEYTGTSIMKISTIISIIGVCLFIIIILNDKIFKKNSNK